MGHDPEVDVSQEGVEAALFQAFPVKKQKFRKLLFQKVKQINKLKINNQILILKKKRKRDYLTV